MSSIDTQLTAIERARIAYDQMMQRQHDAVLHRQSLARARIVRLVTGIIGVLMLTLGIAIHNGWTPKSLLSWARSDSVKSSAMPNAPIRSVIKGNTCQELQFNNDRGVYVAGSVVPCDTGVRREAVPPAKGSRLNAIRDAFTSH